MKLDFGSAEPIIYCRNGTVDINNTIFLNGTVYLNHQDYSTILSVGSDNTDTEFAGSIRNRTSSASRHGALIRTGTGTFTLSGVSTYDGPTTVNGGALIVNGSLEYTDGMLVSGDGTRLGGNGKVNTLVTLQDGATLAPGTSPGTFTIGSLSMQTAFLEIEIASNAVSGLYDKLVVNGTVSLEPAFGHTELQLKLLGATTRMTSTGIRSWRMTGTIRLRALSGMRRTRATSLSTTASTTGSGSTTWAGMGMTW